MTTRPCALTGDETVCACGAELVVTRPPGRVMTRCKRTRRVLREALPSFYDRMAPVTDPDDRVRDSDAIIARHTNA